MNVDTPFEKTRNRIAAVMVAVKATERKVSHLPIRSIRILLLFLYNGCSVSLIIFAIMYAPFQSGEMCSFYHFFMIVPSASRSTCIPVTGK